MTQGIRSRLAAATAVCALALGLAAPAAAQQGDVVSLQDQKPTAEDIVRTFTQGDGTAQEPALPPGLLPAGAGGGTVTTRGIRLMDASAAPSARQPAQEAPRDDGPRHASAAAPPPPPPAAADCGSGRAIAVSVEFALDSYALEPDAYSTLREVAAAMNSDALAACSFVIEGHTDAQGDDAYNLRLSQQRAESVRDFLTALDVAPARLRAVGRGERELLDPAAPDSPRNRRVQFRIGG